MAYTVKRKPQKPAKPAGAGASVLNKLKPDHLPIPTETLQESAHEVGEKLKEDISRMTRFRRAVSLRPIVGCLDCDTTGKVTCTACGGAGSQKLVWNDEVQQCATCEGTGQVTCAECMGRGTVENVHRKKLIWVLAFGGLAWAYVLFRLWGGDILPEQRAKYLSRGGGGGSTGISAPAGNVLGHKPAHQMGTPGSTGAPGAAVQPGAPVRPGMGQPAIGQPGMGQPGMMGQPGGARSMGGGFGVPGR